MPEQISRSTPLASLSDTQLDQPFQHYSARHRVVAWVSRSLFDGVEYRVRHGLLAGLRRRGGLGFLPGTASAVVETPETRFWRSLDLRGQTVFDVGAFQGLMTMFFARQADRVVSFEPMPLNRTRLEQNLQLNGVRNVTVIPLAAGDESAEHTLDFDPLMPGGASLDASIREGVRSVAPGNTATVTVRPLDVIVRTERLPLPTLVKIDVEGFEAAVLRGGEETLKTAGPAVFIELHGETIRQKWARTTEVLALVRSFGYGPPTHVETGARLTEPRTVGEVQGHLYYDRISS